jgi:ribose transport system substrate-binding protein
MMRRLLAVALAMGLLMAACGEEEPEAPASPSASPADVEIETLGPGGESPTPASEIQLTEEQKTEIAAGDYTAALLWHTAAAFTDGVTAGAREAFEELGIEVIAETNAEFDAAKQANDVETILAQDPDIILSLVIDPVSGAEAFRPAVDAGVQLVFLSNVPEGYVAGQDYVGIVTDDLAGMGKAAAELLGDGLGGDGEVGWMFHDASYYVTNQRDQAFKAWTQARYPGIEIVSEEGMADPAKAEEIASAMLTRNPELTGMYTPWATPAEGALAAIRASGREDVKVVTLDLDTVVAVDMCQGGSVVGIASDVPFELGRTMAIEGALGLLGEDVPPFTIVPAIKVTADNVVDAWREAYAQDPPPEVLEACG